MPTPTPPACTTHPPAPTPAGSPADWLTPQWPAPARVRAVCTTRQAGLGAPPFDSMNLGLHVGDDAACVVHNRLLLRDWLRARPVFLQQVHGVDCLALTPDTPDGAVADASVARAPGLTCTVMVADCLPVLLCRSDGSAVAAAHAGWRGLLGQGGRGVLEATVAALRGAQDAEAFSPPAHAPSAWGATEIIAWLGPCIGPQAFEVGDEVRSAFVQVDAQAALAFVPHGPGKWLADLPALARQRLRAAGVSGILGNDGSPSWCTVGNPLRFFSYRRDRVSGRMAACIWLE